MPNDNLVSLNNVYILLENDLHSNCKKVIKLGECKADPCFHVNEINENILESCTEPGTYDYYSNSAASFVLTFLGVSVFLCGKNRLLFLLTIIETSITRYLAFLSDAGFITLLIFKIQLKEKGKFSTKEKSKKVYNSDNIDSIHAGELSQSNEIILIISVFSLIKMY